MTLRKACCLMLAALLAVSLFACAKEPASQNPTDTTAAAPSAGTSAPDTEPVTEAVTTTYLDTLTPLDVSGVSFRTVAQNTESRQNFYMEEKGGDLLNEALYDRNMAVEERLGIKFVDTGFADRGECTRVVQNSVTAQSDDFDIVINSLSDGMNTLSNGGYLTNLRRVPYLTLDGSTGLWNSAMYNNFDFGGRQYITTGPITLVYLKTPIVMLMNKRLAEDNGIPDIYQTGWDGKWTVDELHAYVTDFGKDLDGDGAMTAADLYGLACGGTLGNCLLCGSGVDLVIKRDDGGYDLNLGSEEVVNVILKCGEYFGNRNDTYYAENDASEETVFLEGRALFHNMTVSGVSSAEYREMEDDFAIIPTPKFTEEQKDYLTSCNTWLPSGVGVVKTATELDKIGYVMETMAYYGNEMVTPAVYDTTMKYKVARDAETTRMLDLIYSNTTFDLVTAYDFASISTNVRGQVMGKSQNWVSNYKKLGPAVQKQIDSMVEKLLALDEGN